MPAVPYLILGNSAAAIGAIAGIRSVDAERPISIVARETRHTYSRPLISYLLAGKVDNARMPYRPVDYYAKNKVEAVLGVAAVRVNPDARCVETASEKAFQFDKLLISIGGRPIVPQGIPGSDAQGVFTFTTWDDADRIADFIRAQSVKEALVVGGGLIGLKATEALLDLGIHTHMVELAPRILSASFDQTASDLARVAMEKAGVEVRCGTTVASVEQEGGKVSGASLRDGTRIICSLVIFAIGVLPETELVRGTAITVDRGILVDDHMQTSVAGIYAAGDVAQAADLLSGTRRTIPILPAAYRQGFIAGNNMAGRDRVYEGGLAMNAVDICGLPTISVGVTNPEGDGYEVLSSADAKTATYKKIVLRDNRIIGAIFIGGIDRAGIITGLIREKFDVSSFKDVLLTDQFGLISLPANYRKHMVRGVGVAV